MDNNEWRKVLNYPVYSVNKKGEVRNDLNGKILNQHKDPDGRYYVRLTNRKTSRRSSKRMVGALVMQAFYQRRPDRKTPLEFINGDVTDYSKENMRWLARHKQVVEVDMRGEIIRVCRSAREFADRNHYNVQSIINRCGNNNKKKLLPNKHDCYYKGDEESRKRCEERINNHNRKRDMRQGELYKLKRKVQIDENEIH